MKQRNRIKTVKIIASNIKERIGKRIPASIKLKQFKKQRQL